MNSYEKTITELFALQSFGIRPGLKSTLDHLDRLGNPHTTYPTIHIAGTNGKGSTGAACEAVLTAAGYLAGLYTSPHLVRFNERIRISGSQISDTSVVETASRIKGVCTVDSTHPTFFEFATLMAFDYFKNAKVDIAVIETGLGGRLDSTNVIEPLVTVITNIARDHTALLGATIKKIANEKAGIIKEGVACVTAVTQTGALRAIRQRCKEKNAPLYRYGTDFTTAASDKGPGYFDYFGIKKTVRSLKSGLKGAHQVTNSACALAALELAAPHRLGLCDNDKAIRDGLKSIDWPGRLEVIGKRPLVLLDSAHNSEAAKVLAAEVIKFDYKRLIVVAGVMEDKDVKGILARLAPVAQTIILTSPEHYRAAQTATLRRAFAAIPFSGTLIECGNVSKACDLAVELAASKDAILVTGSIFTVGAAKLWSVNRARNL